MHRFTSADRDSGQPNSIHANSICSRGSVSGVINPHCLALAPESETATGAALAVLVAKKTACLTPLKEVGGYQAERLKRLNKA